MTMAMARNIKKQQRVENPNIEGAKIGIFVIVSDSRGAEKEIAADDLDARERG